MSTTFKSGRFVLLLRIPGQETDGYVTSWDTWEECVAAFPIHAGFYLLDQDTGQEWLPGAKYEWEAVRP